MLQKVRPFTAADVEKVAEMFVSVPDGWSKTALEESLANESIKSFVLEADGPPGGVMPVFPAGIPSAGGGGTISVGVTASGSVIAI